MTVPKDILRDAAERGIRYREAIGTRRVGPSGEDVAAVSAFDEALTDDGCDASATLAMLDEIGSPASTADADVELSLEAMLRIAKRVTDH